MNDILVKKGAVGITEIFPSPTVKKVIFQILYPNLFIIENRIGQLQLKIMEKFGESKLILRQQFFLADIGEGETPKMPEKSESPSRQIWQFHSGDKYALNITSKSLDISSNIHKSYNRGDGENFRDIIKYVLDKFMEDIKIPIIKRIGLRYQDEMPIFERNNEAMMKYYNTTFDIERFKFEEADAMVFTSAIKRGDYRLNYRENYRKVGDDWKYTIDFDSYAVDVKPDKYLDVLDKLHEIINIEYNDKITEKFKEHMRKGAA